MLKETLVFIAGCAIGAVSSWFICKHKYEKIFQNNLEDIRNYYVKEVADLEKRLDSAEEAMKEPAVVVAKPEESKKMVDYTKFLETDPEDEDVFEENYIMGEDESKEREKEKARKPKIIRSDQYGENAGWDAVDLEYYKTDGILCTETGEVLDISSTVGDAIDKYGFAENDETRLFVRNYAHECDYEIAKIFASYADAYN